MKRLKSDIGFQLIVFLIFTVLMLLCVYPFYNIILNSLSDPQQIARKNIVLVPAGFTLKNYSRILGRPDIFKAFLVSVGRTVVGTAITVFFTSILAYTLTKKELPWRRFIYRVSVASLFLNAGIIPWYLIMRSLHLTNTFLAYVLPGAVAVFSLVLVKTQIEQIPVSIEESARVDGANYFAIFLKIIIPMVTPVIAAIALFSAVNQWNSWYDNLLLVRDRNLQTLQLMLWKYLHNAEAIATEIRRGTTVTTLNEEMFQLSPFSIRMTITIIVIAPILFLYPFLQRYFVGGILIGAVKG